MIIFLELDFLEKSVEQQQITMLLKYQMKVKHLKQLKTCQQIKSLWVKV